MISILIAFRRNRNQLYFKFSMKTVLLETGVPVLVVLVIHFISGVENLIIWQFWWLVELLELFHGCPHTLLTQSKLECKEMVLAKTKSSKVPCTVSELQSQVSKKVYIQQWFALASVLSKENILLCSIGLGSVTGCHLWLLVQP